MLLGNAKGLICYFIKMLIVSPDTEIGVLFLWLVVCFFYFFPLEREKSLNGNQFRGNTLKISYDVRDLAFLRSLM